MTKFFVIYNTNFLTFFENYGKVTGKFCILHYKNKKGLVMKKIDNAQSLNNKATKQGAWAEKAKNSANSTKNSTKAAQNSTRISRQNSAKAANSTRISKQNSAKISKISPQKSYTQTPTSPQNSAPEKPKKSARFLARQKKIKRVALRFFLAKGYEGTNVRDIIKTSGGSFSDIYGTFKDKQGLFVGVLSDLLSVKRNIYTKLLNKNLPMREFLYKFSIDIMGTFLEKKALHLAKIIYSQLYKRSNRALIEYFKENKENAPGKVLVSYFQRCEPPLCDEAQRYAELFFTMLKGRCVDELFFHERVMSKQEQEQHCAFVVDFFIRGLPK